MTVRVKEAINGLNRLVPAKYKFEGCHRENDRIRVLGV